jgi:hypothetical protein
MKDKDFKKLLQFKNMKGSALVPHNAAAHEFLDYLKQNEIVTLKNVTARDLKLHQCYFVLLAEVWGYMPKVFRDKIEKGRFYEWIKIYQGRYNILYEFRDGNKMIEVESISFGRMNNNKFKDYVKDQLPVLYEILLIGLDNELANDAIETIEQNFERYFAKL